MSGRAWRRWAAALGIVLVGLAPLAAAVPAQADEPATPANPIQVVLTRLTPIAPQPGDTLVLAGTLRNTTAAPIGDLYYELKTASVPLASRSDFDSYAADQDGDLSSLGGYHSPPTPAQPATLQPGQTAGFRIAVPVDSLNLGAVPQVREIGVSVSSGETPEGHLRTFLPWAPAGSTGSQLGVAWIWPLADRPHRVLAGQWIDDELAGELADTGRLGGLLAAGTAAEAQQPARRHGTTRSVPVTWAIDPMLVGEVKAMTSTYHVPGPDGSSVTGKGGALAKTWLSTLHGAVTRPAGSVLALPYADPDVVAAVRAGFASAIGLATVTGRDVLHQVLGVNPDTAAWPPGGLVDQHSVNVVTAAGDTPLVLSDTALPPVVAPPATPNAHTTLTTNAGQVDTLLTDAGLADAVNSGLANPDGWRVSLQRFLARTLMVYAEAPNTPRDVVVAPNRHWDPSPSYAMKLLSDTGKVPWIRPVSLTDVDGTPVSDVVRQPLHYPGAARRNELPGPYLRDVAALRHEVNAFAAILPQQGDPQVQAFSTAEQQTLSTGWRSYPQTAAQTLSRLDAAVRRTKNQVRITSKPNSYVTLTSHGGKVPVTIANGLDTPARVTVELLGNQRLALSQHGRVTVEVPPHQQENIAVHAAAKTSGVFPLQVQLLTPGGQLYGAPVKLFVRSTVYGTITLVITAGAAAALFIAVGFRLVRRAAAARRSPASAGP